MNKKEDTKQKLRIFFWLAVMPKYAVLRESGFDGKISVLAIVAVLGTAEGENGNSKQKIQ